MENRKLHTANDINQHSQSNTESMLTHTNWITAWRQQMFTCAPREYERNIVQNRPCPEVSLCAHTTVYRHQLHN